MNTLITLLLLAVLAGAAIASVRRFRKGSTCCGTHPKAVKRVGISDRDPAHYPYTVMLKLSGMTCVNCARRVENALNQTDGIWASVDIGSHSAKVRLTHAPDTTVLRRIVADAGYVVTEITPIH